MEEIDQHKIFKKLDAPTMFVSIPLTDLWQLVIPSACALVLSSSIGLTVGILLVTIFLKKHMKRLPKNYFMRAFYWYFPTAFVSRASAVSFAPSHVKRWLRR